VRWFRITLALVSLAILVQLLRPLLDEVQAAGHLFATARWSWLPVALACQVLSYGFLARLNSLALVPFAGRISLTKLAAVMSALSFVEVAVPTAGLSGMMLRARLLGRQGFSFEAALASFVVETLALAVAIGSIGLLGVAALLPGDGWPSVSPGGLRLLAGVGLVAVRRGAAGGRRPGRA